MARPTFTASEVARYVFCNLAWSYDVLGVPTLSPAQVRKEKAAILAKSTLSDTDRQDLAYLKGMEQSYARRASGERYHAALAQSATTFQQITRLVFVAVFIIVVVVLVLLFVLR